MKIILKKGYNNTKMKEIFKKLLEINDHDERYTYIVNNLPESCVMHYMDFNAMGATEDEVYEEYCAEQYCDDCRERFLKEVTKTMIHKKTNVK